MAKNLGNVYLQIDSMISKLDDEEQRLRDTIERWLQMVVHHVAERATANAPILTGDLRAALTTTKPSWNGNEIGAKVIDTVEYALLQHEVLTPAGHFQLGPISVQQPMTPEGGVGGWYIKRVVQFHLNRYEDLLKKMLESKGLDVDFTIIG